MRKQFQTPIKDVLRYIGFDCLVFDYLNISFCTILINGSRKIFFSVLAFCAKNFFVKKG